jgi:hypothetical protein
MVTDKAGSEASDKLYKGTKIGVASTAALLAAALSGPAPLAAGGAALAVELFSATFGPPLEKRRNRWMETLDEKLKELEMKIDGFTIENLAEDEVFITTLINATQIAIRSHQKEKLDSLRNAVLNAALPNSLDDELQLLFLSFLDTFSATHIRLLKFLDTPQSFVERSELNSLENDACLNFHIEKIFPGFSEESGLYSQIFKDLKERGLVSMEAISVFSKLKKSLKELRIKDAVSSGNINEAFSHLLDNKKEDNESMKPILYKLLRSSDSEKGLLSDLGKAFTQFLSSPI